MVQTGRNLFIYAAALSISFICFTTGISVTWSSPLLPRFQSFDATINPLRHPLTVTQAGLIVSIINVGLIVGPFLAAALVGRVGKKYTILVAQLPMLVAHIMCTMATSFEVFLAARILMGITGGITWSVVTGYLSEISEPKNRGVLNSFVSVMATLGALFSYIVGAFLSVKMFSMINLIPSIIFLVVVYLFIPSSPYDLVMARNSKAAKESLIKLRQTHEVDKELLQIEKTVESSSSSSLSIMNIFRDKVSSRAMFICGSLMFINGCSGILVMLGYTQTIFGLAGSAFSPEISSIIVGCVATCSTFLNTQLIDRLGRRPIIILSCAISSLAHGTMGVFFLLRSLNYDVTPISWLPVCAMLTFMFSHHIGLGLLPWVVLGELFSPRIKSTASTICNTVNSSMNLLITMAYPYMVEYLGISNSFFIFSGALACGVVYCIFWLPETKGKTFDEIHRMLDGSKN